MGVPLNEVGETAEAGTRGGAAPHSERMLLSRITADQRATSSAVISATRLADAVFGITPKVAKLFCTSGSCTAFVTASFSFATTSAGMPAGPTIANQLSAA